MCLILYNIYALLAHIFCHYTRNDRKEQSVIPAPDEDVRGQAPSGIYPNAVIPAKAGIQY